MESSSKDVMVISESIDTSEEYCDIDINTRKIIIPSKYQILGVQEDDDSTRINFRCLKQINEDMDLSADKIFVNYKNVFGEISQYEVIDTTIVDDYAYFSWLLSKNVTKKSGDINFQLCIKKIENEVATKEWHTTIATSTVIDGLPHDGNVDFIINTTTRDLELISDKTEFIQYDHNSENICFQLSKYIDGYDISQCEISIHFLNVDNAGISEASNIRFLDSDSDENEDVILFDWKISNNVTFKIGEIKFLIKINTLNDKGDVIYSWNTNINRSLRVIEGLNNEDIIFETNKGLLEEWEQRLFGISDTEESKIKQICDDAAEEVMNTFGFGIVLDKNGYICMEEE